MSSIVDSFRKACQSGGWDFLYNAACLVKNDDLFIKTHNSSWQGWP
jgi:hypothetical protein